ncbi:hypothetical protein T05_14988 [Trichinella murrelli]|uniref:Uncharacterized protein n=1 Tax=Trichinella murrelli TaxID=144512 RepID=A0A0V0U3F9_9BILA|nr:hypothetical protein T05_14988 [Trichinella murrelli]
MSMTGGPKNLLRPEMTATHTHTAVLFCLCIKLLFLFYFCFDVVERSSKTSRKASVTKISVNTCQVSVTNLETLPAKSDESAFPRFRPTQIKDTTGSPSRLGPPGNFQV